MKRDATKLSETLRSRRFSIGLHVVLWLLVALVLKDSKPGENALPFSEASVAPSPANIPVPVAKLLNLFAPAKPQAATPPGRPSFFATTHFIPRTPSPTAPPAAPVPPPPTTWKLELSYQGFYRTADGPKYAVIRMGEKLVSITEGSMLVTNLYVVDATARALTLTNTAVQTNVLALNTKQVIEVPLK